VIVASGCGLQHGGVVEEYVELYVQSGTHDWTGRRTDCRVARKTDRRVCNYTPRKTQPRAVCGAATAVLRRSAIMPSVIAVKMAH